LPAKTRTMLVASDGLLEMTVDYLKPLDPKAQKVYTEKRLEVEERLTKGLSEEEKSFLVNNVLIPMEGMIGECEDRGMAMKLVAVFKANAEKLENLPLDFSLQ